MITLIDIVIKYHAILINGTVTTIVLSLITVVLSLFFGVFLALMKIGSVKPLRWIANMYVEFIRGTPLLVQIAIVFYGLPMLGIDFPSIMIGHIDLERLMSGILALTVNSSAYVCEIIRSGIMSVDKGQMEAARSIGFSGGKSMRLIVLPQAIKNILPAIGNEFVSLIKESSQVSIIGMAELMYAADTIRGISFKPFAPLIIVALIYFVITFSISCMMRCVEKNMNKNV